MTASDKDKTKEELKEELAAADMPVSGNKAELEERVEDLSKQHIPDRVVVQIPPGK